MVKSFDAYPVTQLIKHMYDYAIIYVMLQSHVVFRLQIIYV